ncbi:MAG: hypothetical protein KAS32_31125 [Candidatus Peribacteraceae bacterium]|nr:hypothetical protein [Candidatus Peribacteraceae bacterium]
MIDLLVLVNKEYLSIDLLCHACSREQDCNRTNPVCSDIGIENICCVCRKYVPSWFHGQGTTCSKECRVKLEERIGRM